MQIEAGRASSTRRPFEIAVCNRRGDLDCNGIVGMPDLAQLLSNFGRSDAPSQQDGDLDADGQVGIADLAILLGDFGRPCP